MRAIRTLAAPALAVVLALVLSACGGGGGAPSDAGAAGADRPQRVRASVRADLPSPQVTVEAVTQVAERRVSRTVFEYDFDVTFKNAGKALVGLEAQLVGVGAGTTIVDGAVVVGDLAAGEQRTPGDRITLRHDRTRPFDRSALQWRFSAIQAPAGLTEIAGPPSDEAVDYIADYDDGRTFPGTEIEFDAARGAPVLRSKVIFGFRQGTKVGQLNTLLRSMGATIVRTYHRTAVIEAAVADPGSLAALEQRLASLRGDPIVSFAIPVSWAPLNTVPTGVAAGGQYSSIFHHLAVKGAPAWNARGAVGKLPGTPPVLLIADFFGNGAPATALLATASASGFGTGFMTIPGGANDHGYHVLGIAAASFNAAQETADSSLVTGVYASSVPLDLDIEDLAGSGAAACLPGVSRNACRGITRESRFAGLLKSYDASARNVVFNTSLGWNGNGGISPVEAEGLRLYWLSLLRGGFGATPSTTEARTFHSAAAGNDSALPANQNYGWTRAALDASLTNTAVVENRTADTAPPFAAGALSSTSSIGGNLSAIGNGVTNGFEVGVPSYIDSTNVVGPLGGTSMASPQVAGLAAYLWSIRPSLSSSELLALIIGNATPVGRTGAPLIDAYASVLALDDAAALAGMGNPALAPVRSAILDLDGSQSFTYADAVKFVDAFRLGAGQSAYDASKSITIGTRTHDLTRFDLNGDGAVGGGTGRFNLDISYAGNRVATYGEAVYVNGLGRPVFLRENAVSDMDVLCYHVYSALWRDTPGGTRADFETYLANTPAGSTPLSCGAASFTVQLDLTDTASNWSGLPTTINLSQLYAVAPSTFRASGNSATCGNQGQPLGERGTPLFSLSVPAGAVFMGARVVTGMPWQSNAGVPNRNNCSSFVAYQLVTLPSGQVAAKWWVNATGRAVFGFGGAVVSDWEYQVRYYSGDPLLNYADRSVQVGTVPGANFFGPQFSAPATVLRVVQ